VTELAALLALKGDEVSSLSVALGAELAATAALGGFEEGAGAEIEALILGKRSSNFEISLVCVHFWPAHFQASEALIYPFESQLVCLSFLHCKLNPMLALVQELMALPTGLQGLARVEGEEVSALPVADGALLTLTLVPQSCKEGTVAQVVVALLSQFLVYEMAILDWVSAELPRPQWAAVFPHLSKAKL
jgi:hypothetical protein